MAPRWYYFRYEVAQLKKSDIAEKAFIAAATRRAMENVAQELDGLNDGLSGRFSLKKIGRSISGAIKTAVRSPAQHLKILKTTLKNPKAGLKMLGKQVKTEAKSVGKVVETVAPVAAVAAAAYFGGPYVLSALKGASASTLLSAGKLVAQAKQSGTVPDTPPPPQYADVPPEQLIQAPEVQHLAEQLTAMQLAQQSGVAMASPEAKALIAARVDDASEEIVKETEKPKSNTIVPLLAIGIPAAIAIFK